MATMGMPYAFQNMLKEGYKHLSGVDEAVVKNLEACKQLSAMTKTSLGPNGMNKMVINYLEKLFVTSDASVIVNELEVQHPAAKLLVMAANSQQQEIGDGANFALEILESLVVPGSENIDVRNKQAVERCIKGSISSKQPGWEGLLAGLIAEACIQVCPKNKANFNVDNVRTVKITGSGLGSSSVVNGMVLKRDAEGTIKQAQDAKVAVFAQGVDTEATEGKGTVLIHNASELENYAKSEEAKIEGIIKAIADTGCKVVVSGGAFGEMALHFLEKYGLMAIRVPSKFELRRICRATNAVALLKLQLLNPVPQAPTADELGYVKSIVVEEIGGTMCTVFRQDASLGSIASIVLRGSSDSFLDDVERAIDDGVNAFKVLCKDARLLSAGGATEVELARRLLEWGRKETGLDQYSIQRFAEALEVVPRTIAENSGLNAVETVAELHAAHAKGQATAGLDVVSGSPVDLGQEEIFDLYATKWWALRHAADAAVTVLRVDQIIMSKQAGGPKPRVGGADEE